jgi:hypothetical protein
MLPLTLLLLAADPDPAQKAGLQQLGEFVGTWAGDARATGPKPGWKQTAEWGWKFTDTDAALVLSVTGGKGLTAGTLTFQPKDKTYTLKATEADGERTYVGKLARGRLVLESKDGGDVRRLTLSTAAGGARLVQVAELQPKGKGPFGKQYEVTATKAGESLAGAGSKTECVVTGGVGTRPVTYLGATYYVCCSGCLDEFNADPKKYVEAYLRARKK